MSDNKVDFMRIIGSTAAIGIPNKTELRMGDSIAVSRPTLHPNLYEATSVKK